MQGRVFQRDYAHDSVELQGMVASVGKEQQRREGLLELKATTAERLNGELDDQLRQTTRLTAVLQRTKADGATASSNLEQCRVKRVRAQQEHTDRFRFGGHGCACTRWRWLAWCSTK